MSPETIGLLMLGSLLVTLFIGFPISFTLIILGVSFGYIGLGAKVFYLMVFQTLSLMKEETLAAVPLFVFMGHMLEQTGLIERLLKGFQLALARMPGSLYLGVLLTATIFATATGIVGASVIVIGLMAVPSMIRSGYDSKLSAGVIAAGGTLGILIPPSVMLVVMGPVAGISTVDLFAGALFPGVLLATLYVLYTMIRCFINPALGPPLPIEERATSRWEILMHLFSGLIPISVIISAALGSILAGLATPTEASGMAAGASILVAACYGRLSFSTLMGAARSTLQTSSMVLFLALASGVFGAVFSRLGSADLMTSTLLSFQLSPMTMLILINVLIFLLGWPFEWPVIVIIFLPIFIPIIKALDIDVLWFCILVAVNLQTAFLSPPVAMSAYYLKGVAPQWELQTIYRGMAQFMVIQLIGLILVFLFPETALWLPRVLFGAH